MRKLWSTRRLEGMLCENFLFGLGNGCAHRTRAPFFYIAVTVMLTTTTM